MNALFALAILVLGACGKIDLPDVPTVTPAPGSSNPTAPNAPNPTPGVVDNSAGFYLRTVTSDKYTFYTHKGDTTPAEPCVAAKGEQADCFVEAMELDLHFHGVSLQYNVPSDLCAYVGWYPYWFYRHQVGNGPALVQVDTDRNGTTGVDNNNDGVVDTAVATCPYDYTDAKGPNCCLGTYSKVTRSWDAVNNRYTVSGSATGVKWGGNAADCIDGPALDTQAKTTDGWPINDIYFVQGTGINNVYTVPSPLKKHFGTNTYAANYWDANDFGGGTNKPLALTRPIAGLPYANAYYDVVCWDRAMEIQSEIRLKIRKWNTSAEFTNIFSDPTQFNKVGFEGAPWTSAPNNDYWSWKDFLNTYPAFGL